MGNSYGYQGETSAAVTLPQGHLEPQQISGDVKGTGASALSVSLQGKVFRDVRMQNGTRKESYRLVSSSRGAYHLQPGACTVDLQTYIGRSVRIWGQFSFEDDILVVQSLSEVSVDGLPK